MRRRVRGQEREQICVRLVLENLYGFNRAV